ncbi:MAG: Rab family GTPase [Gemmatimonadaceae bacterium]
MTRIQRKICLLGATSVGKTSLVRRFVESVFSERYQATIGVKIDRKVVQRDDTEVSLAIWDLQGSDELERVRASYLRGASGVLIVADGTRLETLTMAEAVRRDVTSAIGPAPTLLLLNKHDLTDQWQVPPTALANWSDVDILHTSAKTGAGVEQAFLTLVDKLIGS